MISLRQQVEEYLKYRALHWVHKGEIINVKFLNASNKTIYLPDTVASTLRKLQRDSIIAVKPDVNDKSIIYKWLPPDKRPRYIPTSERLIGQERHLFKNATNGPSGTF